MNFYKITYVQAYVGEEHETSTKYVFADSADEAYQKVSRYLQRIGIAEWIMKFSVELVGEEKTDMAYTGEEMDE